VSAAAARLVAYAERAENGVLDEPATARALSGYLMRGLDCGAFTEDELSRLGADRALLSEHAGRVPAG
jgi:hypothetical protein